MTSCLSNIIKKVSRWLILIISIEDKWTFHYDNFLVLFEFYSSRIIYTLSMWKFPKFCLLYLRRFFEEIKNYSNFTEKWIYNILDSSSMRRKIYRKRIKKKWTSHFPLSRSSPFTERMYSRFIKIPPSLQNHKRFKNNNFSLLLEEKFNLESMI